MLFYFLLMIAVFAADRFSKVWLADYLSQNGPVAITEWLTFYLTYNRGVAFGMFQGIGQVVGWLTLIILVVMVGYMRRLPREMWLMRLGLALVVGGAAGNLIDRITTGEVVDFIALSFFPWVFNLADIAVNGGMVIALLGSFVPQQKKELEESGGAEELGKGAEE